MAKSTNRHYYRPHQDWTPESPRPTFKHAQVGNFGRNKKKREVKEMMKSMTRKQFQEAKVAARREMFKERRGLNEAQQ